MQVSNKKQQLKLELIILVGLAKDKFNKVFEVGEQGQVLSLLQWASTQNDLQVRESLVRVGEHLNPGHKRFFDNDVVFELGEITEKVEDDKKGKKRIIYRGQEKWV